VQHDRAWSDPRSQGHEITAKCDAHLNGAIEGKLRFLVKCGACLPALLLPLTLRRFRRISDEKTQKNGDHCHRRSATASAPTCASLDTTSIR
jgi:hypothetical protein